MGETIRLRSLVLASLVLCALPAAAQDKPAEARQRISASAALRRLIERLPAAAVEKPAATPTPAPDAAPATPDAASGAAPDATPAPQASVATLEAQIAEDLRLVPAAALKARDILFVPLEKTEEARTRQAVLQQIQDAAVAPPGPLPLPTAVAGAPTPVPPPGGEGGVAPAPLPNVVMFGGAIRTLAAAGTELTLKAVALGGLPLRYVAERRRFEGSINVGVVDIGGQGAARALSEPIVFQVTGPLAEIPELARVATTAPPYRNVALAVEAVTGAVDVQIISSVTPEGVTFTVPVQPALFVDVTPRRIQGWGLETADVEVHARALPAGGNRQVQLVADTGHLEPRRLTLDADGTAEASIRSAATGKSTVTVSGPAFAAATVPIEFLFPTWFLVAGLVGGVAGGALRIGLPRPGRLPRFFARLAAAVICGFLVLGLYLLGVNVVGFQLPARAGELLVFVVAALGALGGVGLLKPATPSN